MSSKLSSERGAILIQVAVASVALIAFSMFVIDYGVMWVSRGEAQNSADSGAIAGAVALAYDDFGNRDDDGPAHQAALQFALLNNVFGEDPDVEVDFKWDPARFPAECSDDTCVRVDVYRTNRNGRTNPLPMIFGQLVGLQEQGVRATAIARAAFGNATDCLKPWAVMDKWEEHWEDGGPATQTFDENPDAHFDKYDGGDLDPDVLDPDVYQPPSASYDDEGHIIWDTYEAGTGFHPYNPDRSFSTDYGRQFVLKTGPHSGFEWGSGWFMALSIGDCGHGANCYRDNIVNCVGITYKIGDELEIDNEPGNKSGPTAQGVEGGGPIAEEDSLIGRDPDAYWDPALNDGRGGVAGSDFETSPRIVAIPLINPDMVAEVLKGGRTTVPIANIAGFFIESVGGPPGREVTGRLVTLPGMVNEGGGGATPSSFLVNISLIR